MKRSLRIGGIIIREKDLFDWIIQHSPDVEAVIVDSDEVSFKELAEKELARCVTIVDIEQPKIEPMRRKDRQDDEF